MGFNQHGMLGSGDSGQVYYDAARQQWIKMMMHGGQDYITPQETNDKLSLLLLLED